MTYKNQSFLFGGDLNHPAQLYLRETYGTQFARCEASVNKACHHGSSDFDVAYLKQVAPSATVFSSGDNGSYDHPLPDAIGSAAKHSTGEFPEEKFASDEFARRVREMDEKAGINLDNESKKLILVGHSMAIAGEAGQIYRMTAQPDWGIDAEIEFKNSKVRPPDFRDFDMTAASRNSGKAHELRWLKIHR